MAEPIKQLLIKLHKEYNKKTGSTIICEELKNWLNSFREISDSHGKLLLELERLGLIAPDFAETILECLKGLIHKFHPCQQVAKFFFLLTEANIFRSRGIYKKALQFYKDADQQLKYCPSMLSAQRIAVLEGIAEIYRLQHEFNKAAEQYHQLIELDRELGNEANLIEDYCDLANMYLEYAVSRLSYESYNKAEESLHQAERYLDRANATVRDQLQASIWGMWGKLEMTRYNLETALNWFEKAHYLFRKSDLSTREGRTLGFIGKVYQQLHRQKEADEAFSDAYAKLEEYGTETERRKIVIDAVVYGDFDAKDSEVLEQELQKSIYHKDIEEEIATRLQLGDYFFRRESLNDALSSYQHSLKLATEYHLYFEQIQASLGIAKILCHQKKFNDAIDELEKCQNLIKSQPAFNLVELKAKCEAELILCRLDAHKIKPHEAIYQLQKIINELEQIFLKYKRETFRSGFFENLVELYKALIRCKLAQEQQNIETICAIENARSRSLNRLIIEQPSRTDLPFYLSHQKILKKDLDVIQKFMAANASTVIVELFDLGDELIIAEIQLDQSDHNIQIHRQPLSNHHELRFLLASDFSAPTIDYLKTLRDLQNKIIELAQRDLKILLQLFTKFKQKKNTNIFVAPHREWHNFPFEAFIIEDAHEITGTPAIIRFPNLQILAHQAKAFKSFRSSGHLVALDAGYDLVMGDFERLSLRNIFPGHITELVASSSTAISPDKIISAVKNCAIFHLSSHGYFEPKFPLKSYIDLGRNKDDSTWTLEMMMENLRFDNSPLIVLSACESGRLLMDQGDEFYGFARAFLKAGAGAVIGSNWKIHEIPATILMDHFYTFLNEFTSNGKFQPAKALSRAIHRLRQMSKQEIDNFFIDKLSQLELNSEQRDRLEQRKNELFEICPEKQAFNSLEFWSGFTCTGVSEI
jgi:CHAT domain-containing protein